ncbi:MAG: hypothetical protein ACHQRJ_22870 [Alphaproteobacteria bacterium]
MSKKLQPKAIPDPSEIEVVKDAWRRFMRAVRQLAKSGPKPAVKKAKNAKRTTLRKPSK